MKRQKLRKTLLIISFLVFPATFYYLSPYLIVDAASKGIINGSFLFFSLLLISSLFLGRGFCGWICPAGGVQDLISVVNSRKVKKGNWIKWIIWIPWIISISLVAIKNGGYRAIGPLYQTTNGLSIGDVYGLITYLFVLMVIVLPAFFVGKRSSCHHICWMSPFMIIGRKISNLIHIPSLMLTTINYRCTSCGTCDKNCPMSLPVGEMVKKDRMENNECILCGSCVDGCLSKAIHYEFKTVFK